MPFSAKPPFSSLGEAQSFFVAQARLFLLALSFLSRLAPAKTATTAAMSASVPYYPLVGAVIGLATVLPFSWDLFAAYPWVQGWLYILLSAWLTRALHLDGLADLLDAIGSGKRGEAFQAVLKDSRMGAFGVIGLIVALAGGIILATAYFSSHRLAPLFFAPLFGRCLPIVLTCLAPVNPRAGLGALLASAPKSRSLLIAFSLACVSGWLCLGFLSFLLCLCLCIPLCSLLTALARREGGLSGDYLGCAIVCGELIALLSALA